MERRAAWRIVRKSMLVAPVSEGHPLLPSIPNGFPSGVNFFTVWSRSSVQYTVSSGPIVIPCGRTKRFSPMSR